MKSLSLAGTIVGAIGTLLAAASHAMYLTDFGLVVTGLNLMFYCIHDSP